MGDLKPSRFAANLLRLVDGLSISDVSARIFRRSLPPRVADAISCMSFPSFDSFVSTADKAWSQHQPSTPNTVNEIHQSLNVNVVTGFPSRRPPSAPAIRGRGRGRGSAPPPPPPTGTSTLCKFHRRWGDEARSCNVSCSRWPRLVSTIENDDFPGNE